MSKIFLTKEEIKAELLTHTFLDLRYDACFKLLIADESHPERLVHFLNSLLRLEGSQQIAKATLRGTEQEVLFGLERKVIFDIYCQSEKGEPIIVEMQKSGDESFKDRMLYYASTAIRKEVLSGDVKILLPKMYLLAVMDFQFKEYPDQYHHTVKMVNIDHGGIFFDKLTFVFVELPKFQKSREELETNEDKWLYALGHMGALEACPKELKGPIFDELFESAKISRLNSMTIDQISSKLADEGIRQGELAFATRVGREEGFEAGLEKGREKGRELGREEGREKLLLQIIQQMLAQNMSWDLITQLTQYDQEGYERIRARYLD